MTTAVTIDAHAGWPVKVTTIDTFDGKDTVSQETTVPANTTQTFHVTSNRELHVKEMPNK